MLLEQFQQKSDFWVACVRQQYLTIFIWLLTIQSSVNTKSNCLYMKKVYNILTRADGINMLQQVGGGNKWNVNNNVIHGFRVIVLFSLLPLCYRNTKRNFWMLCCRWFVVEYMYSLIKRYINYNNVLVIVGDLNWRHCWCTCWRLLQIGDVVNKKCH